MLLFSRLIPPKRRRVMTTTMTHKAELLTRLAALRARMSGIESELDEPGSADWEDLASERADDEVLEGMGLSAQQEVRMIEAALKRIEDRQTVLFDRLMGPGA